MTVEVYEKMFRILSKIQKTKTKTKVDDGHNVSRKEHLVDYLTNMKTLKTRKINDQLNKYLTHDQSPRQLLKNIRTPNKRKGINIQQQQNFMFRFPTIKEHGNVNDDTFLLDERYEVKMMAEKHKELLNIITLIDKKEQISKMEIDTAKEIL